ncbi:MAG: DegT/DnrJ/EryC1/StrS family aminotransferase, partial [Bdellovibrionota bacterium]
DDENLYSAMKEVREHGSAKRYYHTRLGLNGRLDTIQCAILLSKLTRFDWEVQRRNELAKKYNDSFKDLKGKDFSIPHVEANCTSVWAQYTLTVGDRATFQKNLQDNGVPTSVHYPLIIPDQPWYKNKLASHQGELPKAKWAAEHVVSLPLYPDMPNDIQDRVIEVVRKALS